MKPIGISPFAVNTPARRKPLVGAVSFGSTSPSTRKAAGLFALALALFASPSGKAQSSDTKPPARAAAAATACETAQKSLTVTGKIVLIANKGAPYYGNVPYLYGKNADGSAFDYRLDLPEDKTDLLYVLNNFQGNDQPVIITGQPKTVEKSSSIAVQNIRADKLTLFGQILVTPSNEIFLEPFGMSAAFCGVYQLKGTPELLNDLRQKVQKAEKAGQAPNTVEVTLTGNLDCSTSTDFRFPQHAHDQAANPKLTAYPLTVTSFKIPYHPDDR